jgi:flagella basal body P-ring formation protein FlgA
VVLRANPVDTDGVVTLGDLFEGAGAASSAVVASGPKSGGSVVLDAAAIQAAARAAGLSWANPSGLRRIAVRGPAAAAAPAAVGAPAAGAEVLTYARNVNAGEVLSAEDIVWATAGRTPMDAPRDADAAIGLTVRKPVRAGTAVSARDLTVPRVIAKDDSVSVHYRQGGITLALKGKALSAASVGEPVRVLNPGSKSIIEAVAAGPGLAVVGPQAEALKARTGASASPLALR